MSGYCLSQGWNWINEGKLANKPKWGFISTEVGSQLVLKASLLCTCLASTALFRRLQLCRLD